MLVVLFVFLFQTNYCNAQIQNYDELKRGSVYFGLGYDLQFFKNSDIHIQQDALKNDYTLLNVQAQDHGVKYNFSPARLNFRLGYYFNYNQNEGIELSFDPCKYLVADNQNVHIKGTKTGQPIDATILFASSTGNYYYLYNGAGKIQVNFTGRYGLYRKESYNFAIDLVGKAGIGAILPKVDNSLDNQKNDAGFQLGGLNLGVETGFRWISHRHGYLEFAYKYNYSMLSNLKVYEGWASQNISAGALVISLGLFLPTTKLNPLFDKGWAHRKRITHTRAMYLIDANY